MTSTDFFRPRVDFRGPGRAARFERSIVRLHAVLILIMTVFMLIPVAGGGIDGRPFEIALRAGVVVVDLVAALDLVTHGERARHLLLLAIPLPVAALLKVAGATGDIGAGLIATVFAVSAARLLRRRWAALLIILSGAAFLAARIHAGSSFNRAADDYLLAAAMSLAVIGFVDAVEHALIQAEDADRELAAERAVLGEERARDRAIAAVGRVLHDDVLAALHSFRSAACDPDRIRAECRSAVTSIEALQADLNPVSNPVTTPTPSLVTALVEDAIAGSPVELHVTITGRLHSRRPLARDEVEVLQQAIGESLRNVRRHSGERSAHLRISLTAESVTAEVIDHGRGISDAMRPGYGVSHSILRPVTAAGGTASFRATPGGGLTVRVEMPISRRSALEDAYRLMNRAAGGPLPLTGIGLPVAAVWVLLGIEHSISWKAPTAGLALVAAFAALTLALVRRLAQQALSHRFLLAALGAVSFASILGYLAMPAGGLLDYRSWFVGWSGVLLIVLAMFVRAPLAVGVIASQVALLTGAWLLRPAIDGGQIPWGSYNALLGPPVISLLFGVLVRNLGEGIEQEDAELVGAAAELAVRRAAGTINAVHLNHTRTVVAPWLDRASRSTDVSTLADEAQVLAWEVRDDLYAPGFFDADLRKAASAFRATGGRLELRPGFTSEHNSPQIAVVLRTLLIGVPVDSTITLQPRDAGTTRMVVRPALTSTLDIPGVVHETDEFRSVVMVAPTP